MGRVQRVVDVRAGGPGQPAQRLQGGGVAHFLELASGQAVKMAVDVEQEFGVHGGRESGAQAPR